MTTTTFELDGYRVSQHLGVVRGIVVRSRSVFGTLGGQLQTIVGGNITLFTELCEKARAEAFDMMVSHAALDRFWCERSPRPRSGLLPAGIYRALDY